MLNERGVCDFCKTTNNGHHSVECCAHNGYEIVPQATFVSAYCVCGRTMKITGNVAVSHQPDECYVEQIRQIINSTVRCEWLPYEMAGRTFTTIGISPKSIETAAQKIAARESEELERYKIALTPSSVTKAALIGEFSFTEIRHAYEGSDSLESYAHKCVVPWTTIKEIMKAIRKLAESKKYVD